MVQWEDIYQRMEEIHEDFMEEGYKEKYRIRFKTLMEKCIYNSDYSAVVSDLLNDDIYNCIKQIISDNGRWTVGMQQIEEELQKILLLMKSKD